MALAWVSNATASNNTGVAVTGTLGTTTTGQLIVITIADDSASATSVTSVTDTYSNAWTKVPLVQGTSSVLLNSVSTQMWYAVTNVAGATHTVTVNWNTATTARVTVAASYFNGFTATPTLDKFVGATGTSTAASSGATATTTAAAEVVVGGFGHAGTTSAYTLGTGYTNLATQNVANAAVAQESKIVAATAAMTATASIALSRAWGAIVATFKDVVTTSAPVVSTQAVTFATSTGGTANGNVTSDGGSTVTARGFAYATTANPTTANSTVTASGTTGAYTATLSSLTTNTTYHIRAYATNSIGTSYGADISFTPVPLLATLTDNFDDNTRGAQWTQYTNNGSISETGQQLVFSLSASITGYNGYTTSAVQNYCLTGSAATCQVVNAGNQALASLEVYPIALTADANNSIFIYISGNVINAVKKVAGSNTSAGTLAYNSTNHKYFRIRESAGTITFETTDIYTNVTWTSIGTTTTPSFAGSMWVDIEVGEYAAEASTTSITFDNFNTSPVSTTTVGVTKSLKYTVKTTPAAKTKTAKYTVKTSPSGITKSSKYTVKTTPSLICAIHIGSQSIDVHTNTQADTDAVIAALVTAIPNVTHIAIGTYLDYSDQIDKWATSIHNAGKKLWLRTAGFNWWLGTNGTAQYTGSDFAAKHRGDTYFWIQSHNSFLKPGDIFSPVPDEPENNSMWNTTYTTIGSGTGRTAFNGFITGAIDDLEAEFASLGIKSIDVRRVGTSPSATRDVIDGVTEGYLNAMVTDHYPETGLSTATSMAAAMSSELATWVVGTHTTKRKHITYGPSVYSQLTDSVQADAINQEFAAIKAALAGALDGVTIWQYGATDNSPKSRLFDWSGTVWTARSTSTTAVNTIFAAPGAPVARALRYTVRKSISATKSLKYTVRTTPAAATKSLKYTIKKTPTAITKSARYAVNKSTAATKTLKYTVKRTPAAITKSTRYAIKTSIGLTKQAKYTVKATAAALTKTAKYTIKRPISSLTKQLKYTIPTTKAAITKVATYRVLRSLSTTKSLAYIVQGGGLITRSLRYTIKRQLPLTKALSYRIKTTNARRNLVTDPSFELVTSTFWDKGTGGNLTGLTFSMHDSTYSLFGGFSARLQASTAGQYFLNYTGVFTPKVGVAYTFSVYVYVPAGSTLNGFNMGIRDNSNYGYVQNGAGGYSANFQGVTAGQWNRLSYMAMGGAPSQNGACTTWRFTVADPGGLTATPQDYYIDGTMLEEASAATKYFDGSTAGSSWLGTANASVSANAYIALGLAYRVRTAISTTKSLKYTTRGNIATTKSLRYAIKRTLSITKGMQYTVRRNVPVTKALRYTIKKTYSQTKALRYAIKRPISNLTKATRYAVVAARLKTLPAKYEVLTRASLSKGARYTIALSSKRTLPLDYTIGGVPHRSSPLPLGQHVNSIYLDNASNTYTPSQNNTALQLSGSRQDTIAVDQKSNSIMLQ